MAANGLYLTIDELARFGHLLLHEGSLNGKQIVPKKNSLLMPVRNTLILTIH